MNKYYIGVSHYQRIAGGAADIVLRLLFVDKRGIIHR